MPVLLISTYDLGRQPFGLASPAAWLRRAGLAVVMRDLSREPLQEQDIDQADRVAVYLPMHTATRLAMPVLQRIRARRPDLPIAAYGLYAPLNESLLRAHGVSIVFGPEAEADLAAWAATGTGRSNATIHRLDFIPPDRDGLPPPARYAAVKLPNGSERIAGATDASRGCKHRCRHCPIVPVYGGSFRVVPLDVVLADIEQQVAAGAQHITFGDADFFNGPTHARRVVEALHRRHPDVTYDATIKIEHLLKHEHLLPVLAATGCLFVTSAVESVDDAILKRLEKNHTRADFIRAVESTRAAGLTLAPTFVAFTPWTTLQGYAELLHTIEECELVDHVAPVQWGLRLLITQGSRLLELADIGAVIDRFDPQTLTYPWRHQDARIDELQKAIARVAGLRGDSPRRELFRAIAERAGYVARTPLLARAAIPYLDEPWYC